MLGCESGVLSPNLGDLEEQDLSSGVKKRSRRSFGGKSHSSERCFIGPAGGGPRLPLRFSTLAKLERKSRSWSSGLKPCGLSRISDVVSGALNKMKTNRTPTNAPQSDGLGRYRGWTPAACDESTAIHLLWIHTSSFLLPICLHPTPSW